MFFEPKSDGEEKGKFDQHLGRNKKSNPSFKNKKHNQNQEKDLNKHHNQESNKP